MHVSESGMLWVPLHGDGQGNGRHGVSIDDGFLASQPLATQSLISYVSQVNQIIGHLGRPTARRGSTTLTQQATRTFDYEVVRCLSHKWRLQRRCS